MAGMGRLRTSGIYRGGRPAPACPVRANSRRRAAALHLMIRHVGASGSVPVEAFGPSLGRADVNIFRATVERNKLRTVRALRLKVVANPVRALSEYHRALRAFYFDLIVDHGFVWPVSRSLGKTGRSRDWNYESSKSHIHRVADRRAHGIAAGGGGVCEGG